MVDRGPGELARTARSALTLQATLLLRATQLRASVLHVDRENNYTACAMHICVYKQRNKGDCEWCGVYKGSRDRM